MKIDNDMRCAIRAAYTAQKQDRFARRQNQDKQRDKAFQDFIKSHPKIASKVKTQQRLYAAGDAMKEAAQDYFRSLGLNWEGKAIQNEEIFVKVGGILPSATLTSWQFETVMGELLRATPEHGAAILKKYGINWE